MITRHCSHCDETKDIFLFHNRKGIEYGKGYVCIPCKQLYDRERRKRRRLIVLSHYGGSPPSCACCGEAAFEFLAIDHINGGGNIQRKEFRWKSGTALFDWLLKNFPDGYQVLCHNCNMARGCYGYCPHQKLVEKSS
jgi:hypothetical protein